MPEGLRPATGFMGVPFTSDVGKSRAFVLGVPFDCGTHGFRIGARQGPAHIRAHSALVRRHHPEFGDIDPCAALGLVDCGDVDVTPSQIEPSFARIEQVVGRLAAGGAVPVTMGGDGSVTLPQLRAMARLHPGLVALHFDAHTDAIAPPAPGVHHSGTQFHYAATEGLVEAGRSYHIGLRGTVPQPGSFSHAQSLGYPLVTMDTLMRRGPAEVIAEVRAAIGTRPVYLCWDMDVLDPSCAPGVAAPSWGGLSAREAISLLRLLRGLRIVHVDVNTVSPPHDPLGLTASLAAALMYEALLLLP